MLKVIVLFLAALAGSCTAYGQCSNSMINQAFINTFGRNATAAECNPGLYAGGNYDQARLNNYVKASKVCQDPWIAQAYLDLGRNINGHNPTQPDATGAGSTRDDCNYTKVGICLTQVATTNSMGWW